MDVAAAVAVSVTGLAAQPRPVYPYSLFPGGISSAAEWQAHRDDTVYLDAGLRDAVAHPAQLRREIRRYVAFRKDGRMLWVDRPMPIAARETVLVVDGQIRMRGRCGNLVQIAPPPPPLRTPFVPPDTPLPPDIPPVGTPPIITWTPPDWSTPFELQPPSTMPPGTPVAPPVTTPPAVPPVPGTPGVPGVPTFVPGPNFAPRAGSGGGSSLAAGAVVAAPEPGTWGLSALGIAVLACIRRRFRPNSVVG